ncbi:hypothetical protein HDZ31DRAFT_36439 [Schizophyllum fasciatum]
MGHDEQPVASPRLPLEVFEYIIDCAPDKRTCLTCALVCRAFVDASRRRAFRKIKKRSVQSLWKLRDLLDAPKCTFSRHIHWLALGNLRDVHSSSSPIHCLRRLPKLATLRIARLGFFQCHSSLVGPLMVLPHLTSLMLQCAGFVTLEIFVSVLATLPSLINLSLSGISFHSAMPRPAPTPGILSHLRFLKCDITQSIDLETFMTWMVSLPRRPPVAHLDLRLPFPDPSLCALICDFVNGFSPTLGAMRINPGHTQYIPEEYRTLDFTPFECLRTFTVEPTLHLSDWLVRAKGDRLLDLTIRGLGAPYMQKVVFLLIVNDGSPPDDAAYPNGPGKWAELDNRIDQLPTMGEVKFLLSTWPSMQREGGHHEIMLWLRRMLPKTDKRGILQFRLVNSAHG